MVVMHRRGLGRYLNALLVVPITSRIRNIPSEVPLGPRDGLPRACAANCDGLVLLALHDFQRLHGRLSAERMTELCEAVAFVMGC